MVLLLGGGGYVGRALAGALEARGIEFAAPSHSALDAGSREAVREAVRSLQPRYVINAAGFTGRPDVDGTEREKWRCLLANTVVP
ncbi:MAG: NAD(P)-dependent oxidoreductase, partial [Terrimicrobiaceae bacterium]|nr:NAD(P)-dependent oxidoreductase [Terrimicrobiaceae bacterium]